MTDIDKIVEQCRRGDRHAQKRLYEEFAPQLFAVCIRYCKNRTEAEDLLHEGFIKIFEKIDQYRGEGSISAWLRRVMVNTVIDELRNRQNITYIDNTEKVFSNFAYDEDDEQDKEEDFYDVDIEQVFELVKQMPEKYKLVFNMYVVENYSHEKIASELGISSGTSKSNLSRARKWLKRKLEALKFEKQKTGS